MKRYDLWLCSLTILMLAAAGPSYGEVSKDSGKTGDSAVSKDKPADSTMGKEAGAGNPKSKTRAEPKPKAEKKDPAAGGEHGESKTSTGK